VVFVADFATLEKLLRPTLDRVRNLFGVHVTIDVCRGLETGVVKRLLQHFHPVGAWVIPQEVDSEVVPMRRIDTSVTAKP
jgi:hypothetical protein